MQQAEESSGSQAQRHRGLGWYAKAESAIRTSQGHKEIVLEQNYPNPFDLTTTFAYALPKNAFVRLRIFNFLGQEIAQPVNEEQNAGYKSVESTPNIASGVYLYRLDAISADHPEEIFSSMKKMLLLK